MKSISMSSPLLFLLVLCLSTFGLVSAAPLREYEYWARSDPYAEAYYKAREWAEYPTFAVRASNPAPPAKPPTLNFKWSKNAEDNLKSQTAEEFHGQDPKTAQENIVKDYWQRTAAVAHATTAKIIRAAHKGGTDPTEPDHITVGFKDAKKNEFSGYAYHVYTGRT
ncbi:hypothetical protein POSPLADRAFT_1050766 [Postia placenta MAD-698-R-SB12]|uniref:SCP domain-containing protein n=1 Tax=Postia placenta MAD-698-R-SB12 TaxID=670580 RepID=A0A1X6MII7_9APHY|nr:hypothetical protein POSPLADRAFT_1050766 [Postia placenta MAD-698-R-SB12]OSX56241.1 hypothetical protein POSPLADRAFT_1050766 [Postia placenta MAD-698-R-SB12]